VTPNLGTPSAGVVTNLSGVLPSGVTGGSGLTALGTVATGTINNNVIFTNGVLKASATSFFRFISGRDDTNTQAGTGTTGWTINVANNYTSAADNNAMITYNARCRHSAHYSMGTLGSVWDGSAHDGSTLGDHSGSWLNVTTIVSGSTLQMRVENTYSGSLATNPLTFTILVAANFDLS
jgi:hypothetical protein